MRRRSSLFVLLAVYSLITLFIVGHAAAAPLATKGDASISRDNAAGTWTLSAGGSTLVLTLDSSRDFTISRLTTASGISWSSVALADSTIRIGSQTLALGNRSAGFALQDVTIGETGERLQLNATFELTSANIRITRHYAIVSGSPSFETWSTYTPTSGAPLISDLNAFRLVVPNGIVRSVNGLRGDNADAPSEGAFTLQQRSVSGTAHFAIGSTTRASETSVPFVAIDGNRSEFYAAMMWSGAWAMSADRSGGNLVLVAGLQPLTMALRGATEGPHVIFGVVDGGLAQATASLRSYAIDGLRTGRPLQALVTYNTWFAYGTAIDEASLTSEMDAVAALGAELFVVDAGWYSGAGADGPFDFDSGLGVWSADPGRFPNGLRPLRDHAHELGLKFGIWVEPERVNLSTVGDASGVEEAWLVKNGGGYGSDHAAQICLSTTAARRWILGWLTALIDEVQPDYLKWDNNMWVNCDREGHEHGAGDGNFAQVNGLYQVLSTIREQYPDLMIENVSGGGNRLDAGMLRYTDVAWMDDRTAPSVHVRHNIEGLSAVFPPAYLLSFVTDHDTEPLHDGPDLTLYVRSRMTGVLGLCFRSTDLSEGDAATMSHEIDIYKEMRSTISVASGSLLTPQAASENGPPWDVLQVSAPDNQDALICAYQSDEGVDQINVKPVGLDSSTTYEVESVDTGPLGEATGAALMIDGIDILGSPNTAAHILILRVKQ